MLALCIELYVYSDIFSGYAGDRRPQWHAHNASETAVGQLYYHKAMAVHNVGWPQNVFATTADTLQQRCSRRGTPFPKMFLETPFPHMIYQTRGMVIQ